MPIKDLLSGIKNFGKRIYNGYIDNLTGRRLPYFRDRAKKARKEVAANIKKYKKDPTANYMFDDMVYGMGPGHKIQDYNNACRNVILTRLGTAALGTGGLAYGGKKIYDKITED